MLRSESESPRSVRVGPVLAASHHLEQPNLPGLTRQRAVLILGVILAIQGVASLCLRNTAYQDEALYLVAGRQLFHQLLGGPAVTEPYAGYFSGLPYLYPVLAGALDVAGGLEAARLFSLACMLGVTTAVYFLTRQWFDKESALAASALFGVQGSVLVVGRLATYDAPCLLLLALAALLALRVGAAPRPTQAPLLGAVLVLAVATKYAGLLFLPVVLALLAWQAGQSYGWRQACVRTGLVAGLFLALLGLCLAVLNHTVVVGIATTTTSRITLAPTPRLILAGRAAALGGIVFALAVTGLLGVRRRSISVPTLSLTAAALLAPAYHLYKGEAASLEKHVGYGLFFAAPLAGAALARFGRYTKRRRVVALAAWSAVCCLGWVQARRVYTQWPNSTLLIQQLRSQLQPGDRILAEEKHVPQYYLRGMTTPEQWQDLYGIDYEAHRKAGDDVPSEQVYYKSVLTHGHYDLILLQYGPNPDPARGIAAAVSESGRYDLALQQNFESSYGAKPFWLWRLRPDSTPGRADSSETADGLKQPTSFPGNWRLELHSPAAATLTADGPALKVHVVAVDGTDWHVQLYQDGLTLKEGAIYELRFRARASGPQAVTVYAGEDCGDYSMVGLEQAISVTTRWQEFQFTFQVRSAVEGQVRAPVFKLGSTTNTVWLSGISLRVRR